MRFGTIASPTVTPPKIISEAGATEIIIIISPLYMKERDFITAALLHKHTHQTIIKSIQYPPPPQKYLCLEACLYIIHLNCSFKTISQFKIHVFPK